MTEDSGTCTEVCDEELDEELWDYVEDGMIKHPLLYMSLGGKSGVARCNSFFQEKADATYRARRSRDWEKLLFLHERPHRLASFDEIQSELEDSLYWQLLARLWIDSENIFENRAAWAELWQARRDSKCCAMEVEEQEAFKKLPHQLVLYRGVGADDEGLDGLSWTLSREKAIWFANRRKGAPRLVTASVKKGGIHAYFDRRDEREVVVGSPNILSINVIAQSKARAEASKNP
ncbi:MAG: hypothetical protein JWQ17_5476 [Tardiphaga sp.]|nr:hypothetical protein [Tardiphaga sp.]